MGMDRRLFERTGIAVEGKVLWQKKRGGIVRTSRVKVTTIDLSIDGARLSSDKRARLPIGASVLLELEGERTAARVRGTLPSPEGKPGRVLLLQFDTPSVDFLRTVDGLIDQGKGGNQFKSEYWKNLSGDESELEDAR